MTRARCRVEPEAGSIAAVRRSATVCVCLVLTWLLGCGCAREPAPTHAELPTSPRAPLNNGPSEPDVPAPSEAPADPALQQLAAYAVFDHDFARAELYTWTTAAQLRQVRASGRLLSADPSSGGRASPFNQALAAIAGDGSATAQLAALLLDDPDLRRRRYAWPSPFATTMGLGARRYGDSLIRIELDARALIGRFEPAAAEPFAFVDMGGEPVTLEQALSEPDRIAALYHLRHPPEAPIAYREYVVCNEAMIQAWSLATPAIRARVEAEIELIGRLQAGALSQLPRAALHESAAPVWSSPRRPLDQLAPLVLWRASLAFDNARYQPSRTNLQAIRETLRGYEDDGGPPLVHERNANAEPR
jgi:hypothetical protein